MYMCILYKYMYMHYSGVSYVLLHISILTKSLKKSVAIKLTTSTFLPKFYNCIGVCNSHLWVHIYVQQFC